MTGNYADLYADQNLGQSFGTCDAGAVTWNTARIASGQVEFQLTDISLADGSTWDSATFYFAICDVNKNVIFSTNISKTWGATPPLVVLGSYWGAFYTRSAAYLYSNSTGPVSCRWGNWSGTVYY